MFEKRLYKKPFINTIRCKSYGSRFAKANRDNGKQRSRQLWAVAQSYKRKVRVSYVSWDYGSLSE